MARNKKVEILSHDGQVLHPITDGDCVIFPDGETLARKLSEQEEVMYTPEVVNSSPMFKVGEGDSSDYSANVLDGAYQEAVLKGQTYVNTIQEPSADEITLPTPFTEYERTQSKTFTEMQDGTFGLNLVGQSYVNCIQEPSEPSYVALGENLEFQNKKVEYTADGQIKSAMLNGMTLVNLFPKMNNRKMTLNSDYDSLANINQSSFKGQQTHEGAINYTIQDIKPNTMYTIIYEIISNGITNSGGYLLNNVSNATVFNKEIIIRSSDKPGIYKDTMTSKADLTSTYSALRMQNGYARGSLEIGNIMLIEGDYTNQDIPYFEGMQSVTMATELDNVCSRYNSSTAKNGKTFTVGTWENRGLTLSTTDNISKYNFKPNTKYLVQFKVTNLNLDGLSSISIAFSDGEVSTGNSLFGDNAVVKVESNGIHRGILTTSNVISTSNFVIKGLKNQWENSTSTTRKLTISQIMCIEYQNGMENWDLPYFETTQLMKPFKVRTMSKNLCPVGKGQFFNCFFKAGTRFTLSTKDGVASNGGNIVFKDKDGNSMWLGINSGTSLARTTLAKDAYQIVNQLNSEVIQYQLEEGSTSTDYVPHQSKITSALEPITLRAIGSVKDTLDLSTGEYVQRIGEITVDGVNAKAKKWVINNEWSETSRRFDLDITGVKRMAGWSGATTIIKSDKINVFDGIGETNPQCNSLYKWDDVIVLYINNSTITTVDEANDWLKQNPIKVQYQLANPITRKISLEYPNLQTYQDITHVQSIAMDGTLIPNIFLPSDISYKAMLKPNTSYNVIVDREVINSTNQLTVNLGGTTANITANRTVVRTPSTLSNETLTFSGKDNRLAKAMLIESSTLIDGDLPHFDGIGDVKLGRVVENLCLSDETLVGNGKATASYYDNRIEYKITTAGSIVTIYQLTKPLINGKKYFVYTPSSISQSASSYLCAISFRENYNGTVTYGKEFTQITSSTNNYLIFNANQTNNPYTHVCVGNHGQIPVNTTMTIRRPILCEYVDGMENWDWESIGYFTGTRNIGNEFMRIGNKNLFDGKIELGGYTGTTGEPYNANDRVRSIKKTYLKPGVYYLSSDNATAVAFGIFNIDGTFRQEHANTSGDRLKLVLEQEAYAHITVINPNLLNAKIQLEEASSATSYVAHKHNSLHILPNEQIPLTFVQGTIAYAYNGTWENAINNTNTTRIRTQLLDLEPNETYRVSCGHSNHGFGCQGYNNSLLAKSDSGWTYGEYYFTTTKDIHKYAINVRYKDNSNITPSALHQVRLEKITDVTLRSIGDVKDELDLTRGVYIQRIGEIVIDGNGNYTEHINTSSTHYGFRVPVTLKPKTSSHEVYPRPIISDKLPSINYGSYFNGTAEGVSMYEGESTTVTNIYISFDRNRINMPQKENNINHVKNYCKTHPMIVQYVLETPIEHKINIPMKNESNQTIAKPNGIFTLPLMYSETNHVDINSQIYPKVQSRDYISYPVIASPSNKYTVFHNKVGSTDLTVNLCGASTTVNTHKNTITTPSSISQYELRLSGATNKISNVCVFSGDYMNVNVPYVQGMMNAVNPIVKNVGKNLFDGVVKDGESWWEGAVQNGSNSLRRSVNLTPVKPNTKYSFKLSNKQNGGANFMAHDKKGKYLKYIGWVRQDVGKFTTPSNCYYIHWYNDIDSFTDFQIEGTPTQSQYEPYKENNCEPENGQIKLTKDMFEQGTVSGANGIGTKYEVMKENSTVRLRSKDIIRVKPNTSYRLFRENGYTGWCVAYDSNKGYLGKTYDTEVFTTDSQTCYIVPVLRNISGTTMTLDKVEKFRLVEVDETIYLRSLPNGVRDELNLETGQYAQRIGEINIRDLSKMDNMVRKGGWDNGTYMSFDIITPDAVQNKTNAIITASNLFPTVIRNLESSESMKEFVTNTASGNLFVMIRKDRLLSADLNGFKQWLEDNDLVIQYELSTPIIKQVDIHNYPHSYKDGHVIIESGDPTTPVSAQLTYRCVTNRSGQIQEHTEQVEKQERQINELETLILENIRQNQNRSQNFLTSLISTLEIEEE